MKLNTAIKIIPIKYIDNITEVILKDRADGVYYTISLDTPMPDGWKEGVLSVAYLPTQDKYIIELEYSAKELRTKQDYSESRKLIERDFTEKIHELQLLKEI